MGVTYNINLGWDYLVFINPTTGKEVLEVDATIAYMALVKARRNGESRIKRIDNES